MASFEARKLIEKIRREHTLDGGIGSERVTLLVGNSLEILSNQLYQKSTHFLLELLQNADDNLYDCDNPTLNFTHKKGSLRIDCNEIGFTADNVEAICTIGRSTKASKTPSADSIGEKGIGFKSVFKVADVVWIASREYTFKLDKMELLGMVAPVWADFPEHRLPGYTSIFLQLSKYYKEDGLIQDLLSLDPNLLIFLRRIKEINIQVTQTNGQVWIERFQKQKENDGQVTIQSIGKQKLQYIIRSHLVENLPKTPKRLNWSQSKLLLAFPVIDLSTQPQLHSQNVYAFLPIRNYGFKFLLQGDFLLTANREDIEGSLQWNCNLRDAVAEAFTEAVKHFNGGPLKFSWPCYVTGPGETSSFFDSTMTNILQKLRESPVLESCAKTMAKPSLLTYVPPGKFVDGEGKPFTLSLHTAATYLSLKYPLWTHPAMTSLGVRQLSSLDFLKHLKEVISQDPESFRGKPASWHSQLSNTLNSLTPIKGLLSMIQEICIIPLRDGKWASALGQQIFFSKSANSFWIPSGVEVLIVDPAAEADPSRRRLFASLGVLVFEAPQVCRLIMEMHSADSFEPYSLKRGDLISHAVFLYKAGWQLPNEVDLWFSTTYDNRSLGSKSYVHRDIGENSPVAKIFNQLQKEFPIIHEDYLKAFPSDRNWPMWLVQNLNLSQLPRLVVPVNDFGLFTLSKEFAFIFRECSTSDVLQLLVENWHNYSPWIDNNAPSPVTLAPGDEWKISHARRQLRKVLRATQVQTSRGSVPIKETILPGIDSYLEDSLPMAILDLKNPEDPHWALLSHLSVSVKANIEYYLRCLHTLREELHPDVDKIVYLYKEMQIRYDGNEDIIGYVPSYKNFVGKYRVINNVGERAAFRKDDLIYVRTKSPRTGRRDFWVNSTECRSRNIDIESEYPDTVYLFRCLLTPGGDQIAPLIASASFINSSTPLQDILNMLKNISKALRGINSTKAGQLTKPLHSKYIFPVARGKGSRMHDSLEALTNKNWYIADRRHLRESFYGKVPLLAFSIEDLESMEDLLSCLRVEDRILSKLVRCTTGPKGRVTLHRSYTASLSAKKIFIKELVPKTHSKRTQILRQIDGMKVSVTTEVCQTYILKADGTEIVGKPCKGKVASSGVGDSLNLFMTEAGITAQYAPVELVDVIAHHCEIKNLGHISLLYTVLNDSSLDQIRSAFEEQGFRVKGLISSAKTMTRERYRGQSGDVLHIPSAFSNEIKDEGDIDMWAFPDGTYIEDFDNEEESIGKGGDRRLPVMRIIRSDGLVPEDGSSRRLLYAPEELDPHQDLQYLGERILGVWTSRAFQIHLGSVYDPLSHWTSDLRSRSGYTEFWDSEPHAPFIISGRKASKHTTKLLLRYGQSRTPYWRDHILAYLPAYHFEIAVTAGGKSSSFVFTSAQLERMRQYRIQELIGRHTVSVLMRISSVYSPEHLSCDLFVDPWYLLDSGQFTLQGDYAFRAAITGSMSTYSGTGPKANVHAISFSELPMTLGSSQLKPLGTRNSSAELDSAMLSPDYMHLPLDKHTIRLISIFPGDGDCKDQLKGLIFHTPFESAGTYRALSYVWGTDIRTHKLDTPDGTFWITSSLHTALCRLRHKEDAIVLWVDAICINQLDNAEKAQQIRLLPQIFQQASSTYAFLGEIEKSDVAIETLLQIRAKQAYGANSKNWPEDLSPIPSSWEGRCIPLLTDGVWASVGDLFDRPWFRRTWIIQEVVAAPTVTVVCGKWMIDWNDLYGAMEVVDREFQVSDHEISSLKAKWQPFLALAGHREWEARHIRWSLILLLETFRHVQSTLTRDRFFALLGFASDGNNAAFEPDYDSPLEAIVLKFARAFLDQGRGIQLLCRAGLSAKSDVFPSWVPDWTVSRPISLHDWSDYGVDYRACGARQPKIECILDSKELVVEGYIVDSVKCVSKSRNIAKQWVRYFKEIDTMVNNLDSNPSGETRNDLKWKVPIAGALFSKEAPSGSIDLHSSYKALRKCVNKVKYKNRSLQPDSSSMTGVVEADSEGGQQSSIRLKSLNYRSILEGTVHEWRFLTTQRGYGGIGPKTTEVGDLVTIISGGRVPFLVRKSEMVSGSHRLVGECYIHGIMDGEGLNLKDVVKANIRLY